MSLNQKISEYQTTILKINQTEILINDFFRKLAEREDPKLDRCFDYGERSIVIEIPFDEINLNLLNKENFDKIAEIIINYRELRKKQKQIENEINEINSVSNILKQDLQNYGYID